MSDFAFNLDVPVRTEWHNVNLLVTSVQNCWNAMFANVDGSQTIAMVTGELLENAIKYGSWHNEEQQVFRLHVTGRDGSARVVVENPSEERDARALMSMLDWIKAQHDPQEAYRKKLLEVAQNAPSGHVSHLGLVRIAYEGACKLDATYRDGVVRVTAELKVY